VGSVVGQGEAAGVAQHMRMYQEGQGGGLAASLSSKLTVERCKGLRCSLTKKVLPVGFMRARCLSHALIALSSSPRK
jgi:hypothetical protein